MDDEFENAIFHLAMGYAYLAHHGQTYGKYRYEKHLKDVDAVLVRFGFTKKFPIRAAGQLHDVIEDYFGAKGVMEGKGEIDRLFGMPIGDLVWAVTDDPRSGNNRAQRKAETYKKLAVAGWQAKAIKLADRIANVENAKTAYDKAVKRAKGKKFKFKRGEAGSLYGMYQREWLAFRDNLYDPAETVVEAMWQHLAQLLEPIPPGWMPKSV